MSELIDTPRGPARLHVLEADSPRALLAIAPGASGSVEAPDIQAVAAAVRASGVTVAVVEPPYAVAGRRTPPRGPASDEAWLAAVAQLQSRYPGLPLVTAGRSFGSRVACRTAIEQGSLGVLCLAFPLHPPGKPEQSRLSDLEAADGVPVLVVQGRRDAFGQTPPAKRREVLLVDGDHSLRKDHDVIVARVTRWLNSLL